MKKLPYMLAERRKNARQFLEILAKFPYLGVQKEISSRSWFGFGIIVEKGSPPPSRAELVAQFTKNKNDVRPIVAGNFAKNNLLRWFDYEIHGSLTNAEDIDMNDFFIGNGHLSLDAELKLLDHRLAGLWQLIF